MNKYKVMIGFGMYIMVYVVMYGLGMMLPEDAASQYYNAFTCLEMNMVALCFALIYFVDSYFATKEKDRQECDSKKTSFQKKYSTVQLIVVTVLLAIVGTITYQGYQQLSPSLNKKIEALYTLAKDGVSDKLGLVKIYYDVNNAKNGTKIFQADIDEFETRLRIKQPKVLLDHCERIYVCDQKKFDEVKPSKDTYAFVNYDKYYTVLNLEGSALSDITIAHELAQIFDYKNKISETAEWMDAFKSEEVKKVEKLLDRVYASKSPRHFFAEASVLYFQNQKQLKTEANTVYQLLDNIYQRYL